MNLYEGSNLLNTITIPIFINIIIYHIRLIYNNTNDNIECNNNRYYPYHYYIILTVKHILKKKIMVYVVQ